MLRVQQGLDNNIRWNVLKLATDILLLMYLAIQYILEPFHMNGNNLR